MQVTSKRRELESPGRSGFVDNSKPFKSCNGTKLIHKTRKTFTEPIPYVDEVVFICTQVLNKLARKSRLLMF